MRPVVRSLTSAAPPGRNAIPHGTCRPVAIVFTVTRLDVRAVGAPVAVDVAAVAVAVAVGVGVAVARPPSPQASSAADVRTMGAMRRRIPGCFPQNLKPTSSPV